MIFADSIILQDTNKTSAKATNITITKTRRLDIAVPLRCNLSFAEEHGYNRNNCLHMFIHTDEKLIH